VQVTDQLEVKPNCIDVIPPNRDLSIFHGTLHLSVPEAPRGQRLPIDSFFRSLAEDQAECAIGVVLSGTGSDGSCPGTGRRPPFRAGVRLQILPEHGNQFRKAV